jgi:hypothetical protein
MIRDGTTAQLPGGRIVLFDGADDSGVMNYGIHYVADGTVEHTQTTLPGDRPLELATGLSDEREEHPYSPSRH